MSHNCAMRWCLRSVRECPTTDPIVTGKSKSCKATSDKRSRVAKFMKNVTKTVGAMVAAAVAWKKNGFS